MRRFYIMVAMHANLLLFQQLIKKLLHQVAMQIATLPKTHPLAAHVSKAAKKYIKSHRAPLHELLHVYKIDPRKYEDIRPIRTRQKWTPRYAIQIPANRNLALEEVGKLTQGTRVHYDCSCINRKMNSAAVMFKQGEELCVLRKHIGDEYQHTVYQAEVIKLTLAAKLKERERFVEATIIGADNQAEI